MSQDKLYANLLSYLDEFYPEDNQTQPLSFSNHPHLQKISDLMTDLLNASEHRELKKDEIQLIIRACSTLASENNDIYVSDFQTNRVVRQKRLASDSEFDDPEVMREKITDLHQQIAVYSTEMKNHKDQVESLRDEIIELRSENDNLQKKFNELKRTREDEVSKLTVQKEGIGDQYKTAMLDLKLETDKGLNLSAQIDSMMKETNEKDEGIEKLQQKNKEQKDLLRKAKSLLKTLESRITEDNATINRLNSQIKSLKSQSPSKRKFEKANSSLKEENNVLRDRMIDLTDSNEKNLETITELINENQRISQELVTANAQKEKSEKEIDELKHRIEKLLNQEQPNNKSYQSRSSQKKSASSPKQQSPTSPKGNFNLSDFEENSTSTFNDVFESANQQPNNEDTTSNNENDNKSKSNQSNKTDNNNDNSINDNSDQVQEMQKSLRTIAHLFKKANIKPSDLPNISQTIQEQENLLNRFRSTIDAQARFITHLINEDYAAPYLLSKDEEKDSNKEEKSQNEDAKSEEEEKEVSESKSNKEYSTASIFKDKELKEFVLKAVEDTRQVAYEKLKDSDIGFDEIILYDSIFDLDGADLLIADQESRGADNELAALAILLSVIIKQRKISESDARFFNSIYKNMSFDPDHPASANDAAQYIDDIHQSLQKLRKFYNSEFQRFDPQKDNAEFLEAFVTNVNEFSSTAKQSAGFKGKLVDLPNFLSAQSKNVQNRNGNLTETECQAKSTQQSTPSKNTSPSNGNKNNNEEDYNNDDDDTVNLSSFSYSENENNENKNYNNDNIDQHQENDDSIFGERINSVPNGRNNDVNTRKLREEINNYKNEIKKLMQQLDDANATSEALQEAFECFHEKNEETEKNALVIIAERDRLQNLLNERDKQFDKRLKNATNHMEKQKDQEIKLLKKRYEDENKILAQKIESRDKRLHEIKKSMKEIIGMYEDLLKRQRDEMRELSKKNEEVEHEAKKYLREDGENTRKIAELQDKIADLVLQRSNDLSLTVTSANNSLNLDKTSPNINTNNYASPSRNTNNYTSPSRNTNNYTSPKRNTNTNTNAYANTNNNTNTNNYTNTYTSPNRNRNQNLNGIVSPTRVNNYHFNNSNNNNNSVTSF